MIAGVLVVDKPAGLTSHDVVAAARRALDERRIGHCGTLDPIATGVLVLAIGPATRLVQYLASDAKEYEAVISFGCQTTTYDRTGDVIAESAHRPDRARLEVALEPFRGTYSQTPPPFSAKKVDGVRSHARARKAAPGSAPAPPPVTVTCHRLDLTGFDGEQARLAMTVSAGFYVRSLAHDLGLAVGSGAVLEALRRTRSGRFDLDAALPFEALVGGGVEAIAGRLIPMAALLPDAPAVVLSEEEMGRVRHGQNLRCPADWPAAPPLARLVTDAGDLVALAVPGPAPGVLHPSVVLG